MSYDVDIIVPRPEAPVYAWSTFWDAASALGDWRPEAGAATNAGGLDAAGQLASAVILSLFTDRRAPDGWRPDVADRRGWWGDGLAAEGEVLDPDGSHLWLLENEVATEEIAGLAKIYAEEALAWLVDDAVASRVDVTSGLIENPRRGIWLDIQIYDRAGALVFARRFDRLWREIA